MWTAFLLTLTGLPTLVELPRYDRLRLFELALCAERIVTGEIRHVGPTDFALRVDERIVGEDIPDVFEVRRFENWTCAQRWTTYEPGQRVLLFLGPANSGSRALSILGGGGEGEMPLAGSDVIVCGYDVHGHERHVYAVQDGEAEGTVVSTTEMFEAVRAFRAAFGWDVRNRRPSSIVPVDPGIVRKLEQSSPFARELVEEAHFSRAWKAAEVDDGRAIEPERLRALSARALGCAGTERSARASSSVVSERWSGFADALAFVGDVDGDGVVDLAAGAPLDDHGGYHSGTLWILFLARDGSVRAKTEIGAMTGGFPAELNESASFGCALAPLGDVNSDGVPDLAVGATGWNGAGARRGGVWILCLARDGTVASSLELGASEVLQRAGVADGAGIGASVAALGDLDGDGGLELALGQAPDRELGVEQGRAVWIVSLAKEGGVRRAHRIHDREGGFASGESRFGAALACVGDVDGDGTSELAISDPFGRNGGKGRGALWIVFLGADGSVRRKQETPVTARSLAGPGDVDGDGIPDLLFGMSDWVVMARLDHEGRTRTQYVLLDAERGTLQDNAFACSIAWAGVGGRVPALAVSDEVGAIRRDQHADEHDAFVWFFLIDEAGQAKPR